MLFLAFVIGVIVVIVKAIGASKRRKERAEKQKLLNQQQEFFKFISTMQQNGGNIPSDAMPSFSNAMATQGQNSKEKKVSIGWIVLFGIVALWIFLICKPYLQDLAVLGWDNWIRMMRI